MEFKVFGASGGHLLGGVLIESDWNLKLVPILSVSPDLVVLIESDWNLKELQGDGYDPEGNRINRIRLEFKDLQQWWTR